MSRKTTSVFQTANALSIIAGITALL